MKDTLTSVGMIAASSLILPATDNPAAGRVYEANSSLFTGSHYSESLTGFATGISDNSDVAEALEFLAPVVPIGGRLFEYMAHEAKDDFQFDANDERQIGEDFKVVRTRTKMERGKVNNRGLTMILDEDEIDDDPDAEETAVSQLIKRLMRNDLIRAYNLLDAAAVNTNYTWDTSQGKDPDQDILLGISAGADASGRAANRVVYGETAWIKRKTSHRAQDSAGGRASAGLNAAGVAEELEVDAVQVMKSRYDNGGNLSQVAGSKVISFFAENGQTRKDSSNIKRFVRRIDGQLYRVHRRELGPKLIQITVEHYSESLITSTLGIRKGTIA